MTEVLTTPTLTQEDGDHHGSKPGPKNDPQDQQPDINVGLAYWKSVARNDLTNNGVLGGYGHGSLPRVDSLGSRMFLLTIQPELSTIQLPFSIASSTESKGPRRRKYALDVGAGIGRVTSDVLLHLFDRVDLVEPIAEFVEQATKNALNGGWRGLRLSEMSQAFPDPMHPTREAESAQQKGVRLWTRAIQSFDPLEAIASRPAALVPEGCAIVGAGDGWNDGNGYDVIWAQWTLGHLSDEELVEFLQKCRRALRKPVRLSSGQDEKGGLIIIKENVYQDPVDSDGDHCLFDSEDSSLTRSHARFLRIFKQAGLTLVKQDVQSGFDPQLFSVHFYALQ